IAATHGGSRLVLALGQHDAGDRMIDAAKGLHGFRRKSDLVADSIAMLGAQPFDIFVLDVVSVRHRRKPMPRIKRFELDARFVLVEQCFGGAAGSGFFHCDLPFLRIITRRRLRSNDGTDLPDESILRIRVQCSREKYFACVVGQISGTDSGRPAPARGTLRPIVTKRGAGCGGRVGVARRATLARTAKSCGPDTPTLVASLRVMIPQATVPMKPGRRWDH